MPSSIFLRVAKKILIVFLLIVWTSMTGFAHNKDDAPIKLPLQKSHDGNFTLTSHLGAQVSLKIFRGKVVLLNFGYTSCPDVCPLILADLGRVVKKIGKDSEHLQTLFVSVDPERDSVKVIKAYLANFHSSIIGLTGASEELTEMRYYFLSNALKEETESGVVYAHTDYVYLIDQQGQVRTRYQAPLPLKHMLDDVKNLLSKNES